MGRQAPRQGTTTRTNDGGNAQGAPRCVRGGAARAGRGAAGEHKVPAAAAPCHPCAGRLDRSFEHQRPFLCPAYAPRAPGALPTCRAARRTASQAALAAAPAGLEPLRGCNPGWWRSDRPCGSRRAPERAAGTAGGSSVTRTAHLSVLRRDAPIPGARWNHRNEHCESAKAGWSRRQEWRRRGRRRGGVGSSRVSLCSCPGN